ncbi:PREDICTED: F-box protein CPR30-like [Nelumbo nucifera]|uniref:F-box protein CPR30-like n=1 Tax=Nelumbo nucifera TaxID=4432 RepID=A0A1U8B9L2_NELNU|nr:PREDICTED: F-box protein CPR30-like [Nelumbo nucifera]
MGTDSWRDLEPIPWYFSNEIPWETRANGTLYWIASREPERHDLIVSFAVEDEEFREIPMPNTSSEEEFPIAFKDVGIVRGRLSYIERLPDNFIEVWVMEDCGIKDSWVKLFRTKFDVDLRYSTPFLFSKDGGIVLMEEYSKKFIFYDPKRNVVRELRAFLEAEDGISGLQYDREVTKNGSGR